MSDVEAERLRKLLTSDLARVANSLQLDGKPWMADVVRAAADIIQTEAGKDAAVWAIEKADTWYSAGKPETPQ